MKRSVLKVLSMILVLNTMMVIRLNGQSMEKPDSKITQSKEKQVPIPAIYFVKARTLKQGHWAIRSYYIRPIVTRMYSQGQDTMIDLPDTMDIDFNTWMLFVSYGITDNLTVGINGQLLFNSIVNPPLDKSGAGLGDVETLIKYRLIKDSLLNMSVAVNVAYPTGSTVESVSNIALGSGTYDFSFRLLSDWNIGCTVLSFSAFYTLNGTNPETDFNNGDSVRFILTEAFSLSSKVSMELTANYEHHFEDSNTLGLVSGSATDFLSFSVGTQYMVNRYLYLQGLYEYSPYAWDKFHRGHTLKAGLSFVL